MRFAHISDLHFSHLSFHPGHLFSKRWIGNLNLLINRKKAFAHEPLYGLIPLFQQLKVDGVVLTGDLTTTSHPKEFRQAKQYVDALLEGGLKVYLIPGNHDHYTRSAYRRLDFYRYFDSPFFKKSVLNLKEDKVTAVPLENDWWLIALDCSCATPLFSSHGVFSEEIQKNLEKLLSHIPPDQKIILINHFPLFDIEKKKSLSRSNELRELLQRSPQIKLYLHGHTHRHIVADLRPSQLPIIVDSGSTAQKKNASWNLLDIADKECTITTYQKPSAESEWLSHSERHFTWKCDERTLV